MVGVYEMFVEKIAIGIYVFLITGVVESLPLFIFQMYAYIFFFLWMVFQAILIFAFSFPVVTRHHAVGVLPSGSQGFHSSLVNTVCSPQIKSCLLKSFSVNYHCWSVPPRPPSEANQENLFPKGHPWQVGAFHGFIKSLTHSVSCLYFYSSSLALGSCSEIHY